MIKQLNVKRKNPVGLYCGIGLSDIPSRRGGEKTFEYLAWTSMIKRCYDYATQKKSPTYVGCTVSEEFLTASKFVAWGEKQLGFRKQGWANDKDILVKGNKIYSPETCCFVPREINGLFTLGKSGRGKYPLGVSITKSKNFPRFTSTICGRLGYRHLGTFDTSYEAFQAYKIAKESHIKVIAGKWKDQIDLKVYEALMSWEIDIYD